MKIPVYHKEKWFTIHGVCSVVVVSVSLIVMGKWWGVVRLDPYISL